MRSLEATRGFVERSEIPRSGKPIKKETPLWDL